MTRDTERQRQFTRRAAVLAGGKALLVAALGGRLYYLQSMQADRYATLAEDNRINLRMIPPPRGRILDRHGRVLASNLQDYRVLLVAEQTSDIELTLAALNRIVPVSETDFRRVLKETRQKRKFVPVTVTENLTWEDVAKVEVNALDLPGISVEEGMSREYPQGDSLVHVVGYVAPIAPGDAKEDPLLDLPGFRIGKAGVERVYEKELRGTGGRSEVEVNAIGRVIRELDRKEGRPGADLTLALDLDLQQYCLDRLGREIGAVVLMDVQSGEVLALVSSPGFDPGVFSRGLSAAEWRGLINDPHAPLTNKAVSGQYAPGSTFKMVVALAALERGTVKPRDGVTCYGRLRMGGNSFHCWRRGGHGTVDLRRALTVSCDVYFYEIARRTGIDPISEMANRLGLGVSLGIDLPAERRGLMPTRAWKASTLGKPWTKGETVICGIGQGYVLSTPLQLAVMTARLANGVWAVTPRLARRPPLPPGKSPGEHYGFQPLHINPEHLQVVREGMFAVVNSRSGTAHGAAINKPGMRMAGKTGTSQVRRITRAERSKRVRRNEELPWELRDHALFVGYAPTEAPRFAAAVIVEHGGGGSKVAAPIVRDVLIAAQESHRHQPLPVAGWHDIACVPADEDHTDAV